MMLTIMSSPYKMLFNITEARLWIILVVFFLFVTIILKDTVMRHTTLIVNCKSAVFGYISFTKGLSVVNIYSPV